MGEARRRKQASLNGHSEPPADDRKLQRDAVIALQQAMEKDPTIAGATVITPGGAPRYVSREVLLRRPKRSDA